MNGTSHQEQYDNWLRCQELKGRKPRLEGEIVLSGNDCTCIYNDPDCVVHGSGSGN